MKDKTLIMIVDDDPNIAQLVKLYLEKDGYDTVAYGRGDEALAAFRQNPPSLMILDIMLPGMDGWQVCRAVRQISQIPIIMLTAKEETFDKVLGLELGADDYMTKPFEGKELLARVKAVLRRSAPASNEKDTLSFPGLTVSLEKYEVYYQGKPVEMPPRSWRCCTSWPRIKTACSPASSCSSRCGALISSATAARWTCISSACAKSCPTASNTAGRSARCGASAINSR